MNANRDSANDWLPFVVLLLVMLGRPAFASVTSDPPKFALIIGNQIYQDNKAPGDTLRSGSQQNNLTTPRNDADDIAKLLGKMKYTVIMGKDLDYRAMNDKINEFATKVLGASEDAVVVIYYAGHGVSLGDQNYLIPSKAILPSDAEFRKLPTAVAQRMMENVAIRADRVLDLFSERSTGLTIMVVDACRSNLWDRSVRGEGNGGLSRMRSEGSAIVGFSARPGKTAADVGGGRNSPFAKAFLSRTGDGSKSFLDFWTDVTEEVRQATGEEQEPWLSGVLRGRFCLGTCRAQSIDTRTQDRASLQVEKLYAPLHLSLVQGDVEWAEFQERFQRRFGRRSPILYLSAKDKDGVAFRQPIPLSDAEWQMWMDGVRHLFKPRNDALFSIINNNASLLNGTVPACFKEFFLHRDAFNASLATTGDSAVRVWNPTHPFPSCLAKNVEQTLNELDARQVQAVAQSRP